MPHPLANVRTWLQLTLLLPAVVSLGIGNVQAREIEGVGLPEQIQLGQEGPVLVLNGAGIRSKFIFDIYVGALYLGSKTQNAAAVFSDAGAKRVLMHFLYGEVSAEKLRDGWSDGFEANHDEAQMATLKERLERFNTLFDTVRKGDVVLVDYLPEQGTRVTLNGQVKGTVPGHDFSAALMRVWLGEEPASRGLKRDMLGLDD